MRKGNVKLIVAVAAVFAAALLVCLAVLSCVPSRTAGRYADGEDFSGEVVTDATENRNHGGHDGWVDLNATQTNFVTGVSWSGTTCTISATGKYFLSADLDANIVIATDNVTVDLCLAGHALSAGNVSGTSAVLLGKVYSAYNSGTNTRVTLNLYDCGGSKEDGVYDSVHYYKRGTAHTLLDGTVMYEGYDFSDASEKDSDGCVRGGLITGGNATSSVTSNPSSDSDSYGGGVSVGPGCTLNMYGGTIAGNVSRTGGGVTVRGGTFTMYGGSISGNNANATSSGTYDKDGGGVAVVPTNVNNKSYTAYTGAFTMNGGRICDNYAAASAGGVLVIARYSGSGTFLTAATTFTMNGGVISGNEAAGSNGGGVYVVGYSSSDYPGEFTMSGGTIRDNVSGSAGGGVYAANANVTVTVTGGEITGNRENRDYPASSSVRGGGLCLNSTGTLTISGSPYIYGNYVGGKICNLGLASGSSYTITLAELTDGARIGVTKAGASSGTQITSNYVTGVEAYFLSDERTFRVTANGSSYLQLTSG